MRIILILLVLLPGASMAQKEQWDVYMAQYEKGPGSTMLNMALRETAPLKQFPFLLKTGVKFKKCTGDGLPESEEFDNLYKVSDEVQLVVNKMVKAELAGTFTYQCERLDYYYASDTVGLRSELMKMYAAKFPLYEPYVSIKTDAAWDAYLSFLYPNEEIKEYMSNTKVVMNLSNAGDKLEKPRQVDHWIYFANEADRKCFIAYCERNKYKIESAEKVEKYKLPFQLQISRTDKVDVGSISAITLELRKEATKCKGDYDGWETFVIKE